MYVWGFGCHFQARRGWGEGWLERACAPARGCYWRRVRLSIRRSCGSIATWAKRFTKIPPRRSRRWGSSARRWRWRRILRAGETAAGIEELTKVKKQDPKLPHTWFNLAIAYKKQGDFDKALAQIQGMLRLVPSEPIAHYQLGTLYKLKGDNSAAIREFETARDLNPRLAAAHFQLYGLYRQTNRAEDAARELRSFQERKKEQEAGSITEDVDWCNYAEIYDPVISEREGAPLGKPSYHDEKVADGFAGDNAGVLALVLDGGTRPSLIAWSAERVVVLQNGKTPVTDSGLQSLRGVVSIAAGDFDNDGRADLCVITAGGAALYRNVNGRFRKHADVATGQFRKAVWIDFDHDYDEDLILFGNDSRLMRDRKSVV